MHTLLPYEGLYLITASSTDKSREIEKVLVLYHFMFSLAR